MFFITVGRSQTCLLKQLTLSYLTVTHSERPEKVSKRPSSSAKRLSPSQRKNIFMRSSGRNRIPLGSTNIMGHTDIIMLNNVM